MNSKNVDQMIRDYMGRLQQSLRDLPQARRQEILEEISEHIRTARKHLHIENETAIRQILAQMGTVEDIRAEAGLTPIPEVSWREHWTPWILLFGGFFFFVGWLAGVVLLWQSSVWRLHDKLLGTLIWPGGLAAVIISLGVSLRTGISTVRVCSRPVSGMSHCVTHSSQPATSPILTLILVAVAFAAPIGMAIRLVVAARHPV